MRPIFPVLHGCAAAHSMHSYRSWVSRGEKGSSRPGDRPAPRESTRTQQYPSGTRFSGSTTSQFWWTLLDPRATSGCASVMSRHWSAYPSWKASPFA